MRVIKYLFHTSIKQLSFQQRKNINNLISPQRLKRAKLFTNENILNNFLFTEILTAELISEKFSIPYPFFYGESGKKPKIIDYPDISFSRSYDGNNLVIYLEDNKHSGVDCKSVADFDNRILPYFFTQNEISYIEKSKDKIITSNILWTRKESFIKYCEKGLEYPLISLDTTPDENYYIFDNSSTLFNTNTKLNDCYINSYLYKNISISVCSYSNEKFPQITDIS